MGYSTMPELFDEHFSRAHFVEVLEALHRDQTGLAQALLDVKKIANSYAWAAESRGSYAWDDDDYQKEFGACLDDIIGKIDQSLAKSSRAHQICCGMYRNVGLYKKEDVQLSFDFGDDNYEDFVERMIKLSTIEGHQ